MSYSDYYTLLAVTRGTASIRLILDFARLESGSWLSAPITTCEAKYSGVPSGVLGQLEAYLGKVVFVGEGKNRLSVSDDDLLLFDSEVELVVWLHESAEREHLESRIKRLYAELCDTQKEAAIYRGIRGIVETYVTSKGPDMLHRLDERIAFHNESSKAEFEKGKRAMLVEVIQTIKDLIEIRPNQALEPTRPAGTPFADAKVAPAGRVAHL